MPETIENLAEVKKAIEDVNTAFQAYKETHDAQLDEIKQAKSADVLFGEKLGRIEVDLEKAQRIADEAALAVKRASRQVVGDDGKPVDMEAKAAEWKLHARGFDNTDGLPVDGMSADALPEYRKSVNRYFRKGAGVLDDAERKALSVGGDPDGGYVVHPDQSGRVTKRVFETSMMRAYASIQTISTDALEGLFDNEEMSSGWVGETASRTETNTAQLGKWRIPVHEIYANPAATQKLLDDAAVSIESWVMDKVADRFARQEANKFVNGDGVSAPRGFLTYDDYDSASATFEQGKIQQYDSGANGALAADPDGLDVLYEAIYGLKAQYLNNAAWFMGRQMAKLCRQAKDSDGNRQWEPSNQAGQPARLAGYPVAMFEDMPVPATGSLSIAFGDMREAYQIVDRIGIRVLRDAYTNKPYVHFYTTKRVGGDVVNFEALKLIKLAA